MGQPTTTPPGGGSWDWDDKADQWVERVPVPEPAPAPVPAKTSAKPAATTSTTSQE